MQYSLHVAALRLLLPAADAALALSLPTDMVRVIPWSAVPHRLRRQILMLPSNTTAVGPVMITGWPLACPGYRKLTPRQLNCH